jgi:hypothetical protein
MLIVCTLSDSYRVVTVIESCDSFDLREASFHFSSRTVSQDCHKMTALVKFE